MLSTHSWRRPTMSNSTPHGNSDPLRLHQSQIQTRGDAIRWACVFEATAPKAGNVYPGQSFDDLSHADFIIAADIAADHLDRPTDRISENMLRAVRCTREATGTNVNLGIVLLLGPLISAEGLIASDACERRGWQVATAEAIESLDHIDGANIYASINVAIAGGMGQVDDMDVGSTHSIIDIRAAMGAAQHRDRIAKQYVTYFQDFFDNVVPVVLQSLCEVGDVLHGIARAHVRLLAESPDTLIARKCGGQVAEEVRQRASLVDVDDPLAMRNFDESLRSADHRLNPGTTADLIAAALYVLIRTTRSTDIPAT